jgi:hypothetical protein
MRGMFNVSYNPGPTPLLSELLIDGPRQDYESLVRTVDRVLAAGGTTSISVESSGPVAIKKLLICAGKGPNRVSVENEEIIISISPELREQFVSFIEFPADNDLPISPGYHHHYDNLGDDEGRWVALDCLPVVFSLLSN